VKDLPSLEVYKMELTCRLSVKDVRDMLAQSRLRELDVSPIWESPALWVDLVNEYNHIQFGLCVEQHCARLNLQNYLYSDEDEEY
jgi:hypothetical protein